MRHFYCVVAIGCVFLSAIPASAAPHKIRVSDPALSRSMQAQGARLVEDYGGFQILETDQETTASSGIEIVDDYDVIHLNARLLPTHAPEVQALRRPVQSFNGKRLHLVHFVGPIKPEWLEALKQTGVEPVSYIPQNAYLIYGDASALTRMQSWAAANAFVQWEGDYADDYKIHPRARVIDDNGNDRVLPTDEFAVQMLDDAEANPATLAVIDRLKLAPARNDFRTLHYRNVIVRLPPGRLNELAAQPEVISIQLYVEPKKRDERQNQIVAGNLTGNAPSGPGYMSWLAAKGFAQEQFTNSNFAVDITDSGVDNGTQTPGHFGFYRFGDPTLPSRVIYNRLEGTAHAGSTLAGCDGHGTLNAHIIAGFNDHPVGFPHTDLTGYHYGLGVCPFVKLGSSVIFDPDTFTSPNYANLQSKAYNNGARISANSWGADTAGAYNVDSQSYDALVRDAQPTGATFATAGNQQMVIVFAAGNAGPGSATVGSPGTGKNVLTVGASENVRSMSTANGGNNVSGNDGCNTPDSEADNANDMSSFSSRGPCADGRQKPDVVAPGTHITGGVAQAGAATTNGTGSAISCFDATGVCALPGGGTAGDPDNFFPSSQQFYTESTGTSHSTPAVAGTCALLRQFFINNNVTPPSPAMTKAFLVNSSRYLNGVYANDNLWSPNQGMGEVNLGTAFNGVSRVVRDQLNIDKFTATGQTRTFTGTIVDSTKPFRVTVAWTDAPGSTTGNAFNNDLDLTVTIDGTTYKGNVFSGASSISGGVADGRNNLESVFLPAGVSGNFIVTVTAVNINSDGVPNETPALDQDFALVIYNAAEAAVPVIQLDSTAVTAESCAPGNGAIDAGETVTLAVALKNLGSANTTNLLVSLLETNGVISPGGAQAYGALVSGGTVVTQWFTFTADGLCGGSIQPVFQLSDGATSLGTLTKSFTLGAQILNTKAVTNSTSISVPGSGKSGPATPYPSTINVSGITGNVSQVTVTLSGVEHTYPDDMDVLLVGPGGQKVMLMSDCGGDTDISGVTLTFADGAPSLTDSGVILSGTYSPTEYDSASDAFTSPTPAGPYGTSLAAFNNVNPNGTWSLYARDDTFWAGAQNTGKILQGWRISITTASNVCCFGTVNTAPVIMSIPDVTTNENAVAGPIPITVGDAETSASVLTLAGTSSNTNLVPNSNILFGGADSNRWMTIAPAANRFGSSVITVVVSDGALSASNAFTVTFTDVNQPPLLEPISDYTNSELTELTFTNAATDPDIPAQTLVYSLSNAPAGATIDSSTGVFAWTPTEEQGPSTNVITVFVTDDGSPAMNASQNFTVVVLETNQSPMLTAIADRVIHVGMSLTITNSASDSDLPTNALQFSLDVGAPLGAIVGSADGVFAWQPDQSYLNTTNSITVRVTDDGEPPLDGIQSFSVIVLPKPEIHSVLEGDGMVKFDWNAIDGLTYRVQFKTNLTDEAWIDLPPDVVATNSSVNIEQPTSEPQRFYRVLVVP
jgi:hypothetical protein